MQRIEHIVAGVVTAKMGRDHRVAQHDLDMIHIAFDRHGLKRRVARHAVVHVVEPRELILVDLCRLPDAGIEPPLGQRGRPLFLFRKAFADRLRLTLAFAIPVFHAAIAQIGIEVFQVLDLGHRRGPLPLQSFDAVFHDRLFIASGRHAEERLKHVMTRQRLIPRIDLPRTPTQERLGHRFGIIPPDFLRHRSEKVKRLRHAFQDRFGPLRRQCNRERGVGIRPDQNQHVDLQPALRKVHRNLAEVRFDPLTRRMIQGDEGLGLVFPMAIHKPPHGVIAAGITFFIPESLENPHPRMPLLRRLRFVVLKDLQDEIVKILQLGRDLPPPLGVGLGLARSAKHFANRLA